MKPFISTVLALVFLLTSTGCGGSRSQRRYEMSEMPAPHSTAHDAATNPKAKLVDPVDQANALNGLPATEIVKRTASAQAASFNLAAEQQRRNSVYNYNNTLNAPANLPQNFVVFQKDSAGKMHALMIDRRQSTIVGDALVEDNGGKVQLAYTGGNGQPAKMDTDLLLHNVKEGQIICQGSQQAIDLEMYAERANLEKDKMDDERTQMALNKFNSGLSMLAGSADVAAFTSDRLSSSVNSWRQIVGADPRAVTGGFLPFQGGSTSWGQFFNGNSVRGFQGGGR